MRPFLPPLLVGALARGDVGLDLQDTPYGFLEGLGFLLAVLALAVASYALGRARPRSRAAELAVALIGVALGALLFAGSLADGGHPAWPGLVAGAGCAALGYAAAATLLGRVRRRLEAQRAGGSAGLLTVYADGSALGLAAVSVLVPPVSFAAVAAFAWLLVGSRRRGSRKYEGLRILR